MSALGLGTISAPLPVTSADRKPEYGLPRTLANEAIRASVVEAVRRSLAPQIFA
jgi:hypothetical protein